MERKRFIGITIWSWINIVAGLVGLFTHLRNLIIKPPQTEINLYAKMYTTAPATVIKWEAISGILSCVLLLIIGINMLKLKELWRKIFLYLNIYLFLSMIIVIIISRNIQFALFASCLSAVIQLVQVYYFTRPKVREQFK